MEKATGSIVIEPWDTHNQALVQNVHPSEWANPRPSGRYNLVVIGAGTAGLVTAAGATGLGAKVALVERELMGGDCLNVGCVPSKALLRAARAYADHAGFGIAIDEADDGLDVLHERLTAEVATGSMSAAVAAQVTLVSRFYERLGDHAVNLARRIETLTPL